MLGWWRFVRTAFPYTAVTVIFETKYDILEEHAGVVDSEDCERNPFARDGFWSMVAYLQHLSEIEKNI